MTSKFVDVFGQTKGITMKPESQINQQTLVEAIQASLSASLKTPEGVAEPAVLLWTDTDGQWQGLLPALSALVPL